MEVQRLVRGFIKTRAKGSGPQDSQLVGSRLCEGCCTQGRKAYVTAESLKVHDFGNEDVWDVRFAASANTYLPCILSDFRFGAVMAALMGDFVKIR